MTRRERSFWAILRRLRCPPQHHESSFFMTGPAEFSLVYARDILIRLGVFCIPLHPIFAQEFAGRHVHFIELAVFTKGQSSHLPEIHEPVSIRRNEPLDRTTAGSLDLDHPHLARFADLVDRCVGMPTTQRSRYQVFVTVLSLVDRNRHRRRGAGLSHVVRILTCDRDGVGTRRCSVRESRYVDRRTLCGRSKRVAR
jgi:hypothetical protein